jgi:hypothetical protein
MFTSLCGRSDEKNREKERKSAQGEPLRKVHNVARTLSDEAVWGARERGEVGGFSANLILKLTFVTTRLLRLYILRSPSVGVRGGARSVHQTT